MPSYIVCQKKRNNPRMDIRICQKKCELKNDCEEFIAFHRDLTKEQDIPLATSPQPMGMGLTMDTTS